MHIAIPRDFTEDFKVENAKSTSQEMKIKLWIELQKAEWFVNYIFCLRYIAVFRGVVGFYPIHNYKLYEE